MKIDAFEKIMEAWWTQEVATGHMSAAPDVCIILEAYAEAKTVLNDPTGCQPLSVCENKLFDHLDASGNGELSEEEVAAGVKRLVKHMRRDKEAAKFFQRVEDTFKSVVQKVNQNSNGEIGRNEFTAALTEWGIDVPRLRVWLAYADACCHAPQPTLV